MTGRVEAARKYVIALQQSMALDWFSQFEMFRAGVLGVAETMALLHPEHYQDLLSSTGSRDPRGDRRFVLPTNSCACESEHVWGYRCERGTQAAVADHFFPYSLGGATVAANRLTLCKWHNQVKGCDIHFFAWEEGVPLWVPKVLNNIYAVLDYARRNAPGSG